MKKIVIATLLALGSVAAGAADIGPYIGSSLGYIRGKANPDDFGFESKEHSGVAYKVFGGYQFNKSVAAEAGFHNLGSFDFIGTTSSGKHWHDDLSVKAFTGAAAGTLHLDDKFSVFGKLGLSFNYSTTSQEYSTSSLTARGNGASWRVSPYIAVGGAYALTDNIDVRLEFENFGKAGKAWNYGSESGRMNRLYTITTGLVYRF